MHVLVYSQSTGLLYLEDRDGARIILAKGYSGNGRYINDPDAEGRAGLGPIPRGVWKVDPAIHHRRLGPIVFGLHPVGHDAYHRSEFFIHGDNKLGDRSASTGCIVLDRPARECIRALKINTLEVIL